MLNKNVMTFIGCDAEYNESEIVLFGAPFDSTTSYRPGARFGSQAIRNESYGLETYSPYQGKDLTDYKILTVEIWSCRSEIRKKCWLRFRIVPRLF